MKHMTILGVVFLSFAVFAGVAMAQEPMMHGGWGGVGLGVRTANVTSLNDFLDAVDIDPLPAAWPTLGWRAHGLFYEHLVVGVSGDVSFFTREADGSVSTLSGADSRGQSVTVRGDDLKLTVLSSNVQLDAGYAVLNGPYGLGYPFVALGGGSTSMNFEGDVWRLEMGESPGELAPGQLDQLDEDGSLRNSYLYAQAGFTYFWPVRFARSYYGAFGMFLPGVTAGVNWGLTDNGWREGGDLYRRGPDLTPSGVFVQLEIAFGGGVEVQPDE